VKFEVLSAKKVFQVVTSCTHRYLCGKVQDCNLKEIMCTDVCSVFSMIDFLSFQSIRLEEKRQYTELLQRFTSVPLQVQSRQHGGFWNPRYIYVLLKVKYIHLYVCIFCILCIIMTHFHEI
jgi:hypothetical protein